MRTLTIRRPATSVAIAATLLAAFVLLFAWPQPAAAHDALIDSSPAADSTVETLPGELTLTFSAALIGGEGSTEVVVTDAAGETVSEGEAELDGAKVTQPLVAEADAGEYHVLWKVVSSDGHPTSGEFGFTVSTSTLPASGSSSAPSADQTAAPEPDETQATTQTEAPTPESEASSPVGWIIAGAVVLLIIVFVLIVLLRRRKPVDPGSDTPSEG